MASLPTAEERRARGRAAREQAPRRAHGSWEAPPGRPDPVGLLEQQAAGAVPELLALRYGRMVASPFAFFRGAAAIMAADLAATPRSGFGAQLCGDAHLANFGGFASPDRRAGLRPQRLRRDASRAVGVGPQAAGGEPRGRRTRSRAQREGAPTRRWPRREAYRDGDAPLREARSLEVWYARLEADEIVERLRGRSTSAPCASRARLEKARRKDSVRALDELTSASTARCA